MKICRNVMGMQVNEVIYNDDEMKMMDTCTSVMEMQVNETIYDVML